jgi:FSR family fosmidomycin resistance protein-like MFS transporter
LRLAIDPAMMVAMSTTSPRRQWKRTGLLFVGHAVNDGFSGFFAPLLPLLIQRLDLSLALAGFLGTIRILTNSVLQPSLGHWIDRSQRPSLVVIGPLLTIAAMSFIGGARSVTALVLLLLVAGVGTALFHPAAASLVTAAKPARAGLMMAFFSSGGTVGAALAPVVIVAFAGAFSLERTPWLILPGVAVIVAFALPLRGYIDARGQERSHEKSSAPLPRRLFILWSVIVLASLSAVAFSSFLAVIVTERGGTPWTGGAAISAFLVAGAVVEFLAGNLSDRYGRKVVMLGSLALATPFLLAFLRGPSVLLLPFAALAGAFSLASSPVGIVAAHECVPGRTGLVSGLVMGLAWGVGGVALTPIGWLADKYGLVAVMSLVAFLPLVAAVLLLFYVEPAKARPATSTSAATGR